MVGTQPPYIMSGNGYRVRDESGRELIDLNNNFASLVHGHAEPRITEAAIAALREGASFGSPNRYELLHAEELLSRIPHSDLVRYTNSGTEAVMTALRLARAHTGRDKCLMVRSAYHGTSDPVLPAGGPPSERGVPHSTRDDTILLPLNDLTALEAALEEHSGLIAALLIDLIPNRAGLIEAEPTFVNRIVELCRDHNIVLICDEVISFRLHPGGLSCHFGLSPDITVLGKAIGGGFPVGAITGRREIMQELDPTGPTPLEHGGTFSGNPVTMAAGRAALELLTGDEITRINELGRLLRSLISEPFQQVGWEIRGTGSLLRPFPQSSAAPDAHRALWWAGYERGLLLNPNGLVALSSPMDESTITEVADRLVDAAMSS